MQAESGQELASILAPEDAKRRATGGFFLWGIGNSLGGISWCDCRRREPHPLVVFSVMRAKPKKADAAPRLVLQLDALHSDLAGCQCRRPSTAS